MNGARDIVHRFNLRGLKAGAWFLGCLRCAIQMESGTACVRVCPNCSGRMDVYDVTAQDEAAWKAAEKRPSCMSASPELAQAMKEIAGEPVAATVTFTKAQLYKLQEILSSACDEGPDDEGWTSPELDSVRWRVDDAVERFCAQADITPQDDCWSFLRKAVRDLPRDVEVPVPRDIYDGMCMALGVDESKGDRPAFRGHPLVISNA